MKAQLSTFKDKYQDKSRDEILEEMFDLYEEKEKLEKELKKYKNANTPSSANKHLKASTQGLRAKKGAKRGAPKKHKGATFIWPASDETRRAGEKLEPLYKELEEEIKNADVVQGDETSHSVNGINHWIWVFCNHLISLFKFKEQRGGDIVEQTLGKGFKGKLVSDGWMTYTSYANENKVVHQRCLDHLRREVKHECKEKHPDLYSWCCDIYFMVRKGKGYKQKKRRLAMHSRCKAELAMLIASMKSHRNLRKLASKIENGGDKWFSCILHPELPMDNNEAERSLRPLVVMRKIIGCLRSELGVKTHEIMMSLISTWEKQNKNVFYSLQARL